MNDSVSGSVVLSARKPGLGFYPKISELDSWPLPQARNSSSRACEGPSLGIGAVEKRPVVVDDAIAIQPMAYLSIGYDHRIIDGAVADEFMSHLKRTLENWDEASA